MKPLVAICVGHSRKINGRTEGGAVSVGRVSEHQFNRELAGWIADNLQNAGIRVNVISEYEGTGYTSAQKWVASQLKEDGTNLALELHFNCADATTAQGHEWLFWSSSTNGKRLATKLDEEMRKAFPEIKARGVKPLKPGDRGAEFVKLTPCPAVICEPFFGSSSHDWITASARKHDLARVISEGVISYLSI